MPGGVALNPDSAIPRSLSVGAGRARVHVNREQKLVTGRFIAARNERGRQPGRGPESPAQACMPCMNKCGMDTRWRNEKPRRIGGANSYGVSGCAPEKGFCYFSELLIEVNLSFRVVPRPLTTAIIASAMPAAISPYSMAVAPDSLDKNLVKWRFKSASLMGGWVLAWN
jgi:hypothetical protein